MGVALENFHNSGYIPVVKILVKINIKGKTMESSARINILDEIPSGPLDLAGLRLRIWVMISSLVKGMETSLLSVRYEKCGKTLSLTKALHCCGNKGNKLVCFSFAVYNEFTIF